MKIKMQNTHKIKHMFIKILRQNKYRIIKFVLKLIYKMRI